jgi:hypothetical protein
MSTQRSRSDHDLITQNNQKRHNPQANPIQQLPTISPSHTQHTNTAHRIQHPDYEQRNNLATELQPAPIQLSRNPCILTNFFTPKPSHRQPINKQRHENAPHQPTSTQPLSEPNLNTNRQATNTTKNTPHHTPLQQQSIITVTDNNLPSGDTLSESKQHDSLRLYFQNINGISKNNWLDWQMASTTMKTLKIDVFGCAETNLNWNESKRRFAQHHILKHNKHANLITSSSIENGATDYQPGGVANCVTGNWTGRIIETVQDPSGLGRWAGHILNGKKPT